MQTPHMVAHRAQLYSVITFPLIALQTKSPIRLVADDSILYRKITSKTNHKILQTSEEVYVPNPTLTVKLYTKWSSIPQITTSACSHTTKPPVLAQ